MTNDSRIMRGFSMVEAAFCVVLVGGLVVASLNTLGASKVSQRNLGVHSVGQLLSSALMSEIMNQEYEDPSKTSVFGIDLTENFLLRSSFDDVDDYNGWTASPPQNRDGSVIPGLTGWRQSVQVTIVDSSDLQMERFFDTGQKRITVTILRNNVVIDTLVGVKTGTPNGSLILPL